MEEPRKRKSPATSPTSNSKKQKKQWRTPKQSQHHNNTPTIEPGDAGIWATCARGKEGKSTHDLRDLFDDYAAKIYPQSAPVDAKPQTKEDNEAEGVVADIEASISAEISAMKANPSAQDISTGKPRTFQAVKLETQCVLFFKTHPPIDPVSFVQQICRDKANGLPVVGCRFVKRLTPMTRMGRATEHGLREVCDVVLREETMGLKGTGRKYAIRPTIRDHSVMKRDEVIQQVAAAVGEGYVVDLKGPDFLVLVEVYRNVLGVSVVGNGGDFERLRRFNLAEIGVGGEKRVDEREGVSGGQGGEKQQVVEVSKGEK